MTQETSFLRLASQWLAGILLTVALMAFFVLVAGVQLTSEETGTRVHRRAVATLTDIDAILPSIEAGLGEGATSIQSGAVLVPDFPIPVELTAQEAASLRGGELRDRILDESAAILYDDGMSQWAAADDEGTQSVERVSTAGIIKTGLGIVRDSRHTLLVIGAALLGVIALLIATGLTVSIRDWRMKLTVLGSITLAAALPCLAAAIAVRFGFKTAQTEADPFTDDMLWLGIDAMWVPIRDYLALSSVGFAVGGVGALCAWLESRSTRLPRVALPPAE